MKRLGKTGATGPRGPQGPRGATGRSGKVAKPRLTAPLHGDDLLDMVVTHFDDVYRQLNAHMKQIAALHTRIDVLIAEVARSGSKRT